MNLPKIFFLHQRWELDFSFSKKSWNTWPWSGKSVFDFDFQNVRGKTHESELLKLGAVESRLHKKSRSETEFWTMNKLNSNICSIHHYFCSPFKKCEQYFVSSDLSVHQNLLLEQKLWCTKLSCKMPFHVYHKHTNQHSIRDISSVRKKYISNSGGKNKSKHT